MNIRDYIKPQYGLFIDGKWTGPVSGEYFEATSPSTSEVLSLCASGNAEDVDRAVDSAARAFPMWKRTTAKERAALLNQIADAITENKQKLAMIESLDEGKPIREPMNKDIDTSADMFHYFAGAILTDMGYSTMIDDETIEIIVKEPVGVVGQIVPWNFPLMLSAYKIAPAIAAGNTVVLKPSSEACLALLEFIDIIRDILPPGVINVVTGSGNVTGQAILDHPKIQKLSFTGSSDVGYMVAESAARKLIPATLELGGKSAHIFFPDLNWDKAVDAAVSGILWNQGQVCCSGSRLFVHEDIYDDFALAIKEKIDNLVIDMPWKETSMMGPINNASQLEKIRRYIDLGIEEGANKVCGGEKITAPEFINGNFIKPVLFTEVTNDMRIAREEIFGPVILLIRFRTEDEVIAMANDNDYGLAGGVWTKDINRALHVAQSIDTGLMWVNTYNVSPSHVLFGGYKKSGLGREGNVLSMIHYYELKAIVIETRDSFRKWY